MFFGKLIFARVRRFNLLKKRKDHFHEGEKYDVPGKKLA
jgi:hypothetical protein